MSVRISLYAVFLLFAWAAPSWAAESPVSGEVIVELQNEYTVSSDDQAVDEHNNMFLRTEIAPTLSLNENFYIDGVAVFESTQARDSGENNYFDKEGLFIEEIKFNYGAGPWAVFAGKFNPGFGIAWDFGRGIWGEDLAEDYEIAERIGFGGAYNFNTKTHGVHTLTASTFFADTTFLSDSLITKRGRTDRADGGVSNTENFSSFVVSLEGESIPAFENFYYKLAYRDQAEGDADTGGDRERGYVVTLGYMWDIYDNIAVDGLAEYVDIHNFGAGQDDNRYYTLSFVSHFYENWILSASYTGRKIDVNTGNNRNDHLFQASTGYDFGQGTTFELGLRMNEENSSSTDIIGALLRHSYEF